MTAITNTGLDVFGLCLGSNVFGWTIGETASFEVLDHYVAQGGNIIDTADAYSAWVPGNSGGESEEIIGRWLSSRGGRDRLIIGTKVAAAPSRQGLSVANIQLAVEDSLRRLRTDYIDIYYAHFDDAKADLEETLRAFDTLIRSGKVRHIGASNYSADRLSEALDLSDGIGAARYSVLQPHYNLIEREFEHELAGVAAARNVAVLPYAGLAGGFLTGKYRRGQAADSRRDDDPGRYLSDVRSDSILAVMDTIAADHGVPLAAVAIAWLRIQPTITAPIASATSVGQLDQLLVGIRLQLSESEIMALSGTTG